MPTPRQATARSTRRIALDVLLDAAESCFDRYGTAKTTMEDVAVAAGVSRGLVYKRLGNRDGLILAVLERRASRFNERASQFIGSRPSIGDALVEGVLLAVKLADRDPYFGLLVGSATLSTEHRVPGAAEAALRLTDELWRPVLEAAAARGELRPSVDVGDLVEWIMHLELALLASRRTFGEDEARQERQLRTLLVAAVVEP